MRQKRDCSRKDLKKDSERVCNPREEKMETISIIMPCYNEEEAIPVYYETMVRPDE